MKPTKQNKTENHRVRGSYAQSLHCHLRAISSAGREKKFSYFYTYISLTIIKSVVFVLSVCL